jgi:hypothetical protein
MVTVIHVAKGIKLNWPMLLARWSTKMSKNDAKMHKSHQVSTATITSPVVLPHLPANI